MGRIGAGRRAALWGWIAVTAVAAAPLFAQQSSRRNRDTSFVAARQIAADLQRATFHRGPFYLLSSIQLADIGVDQQFSLPTQEQVSGFGFGISAPQKLYFVPRRKIVLSVAAVPSYHWSSTADSSNQFGYSVRGDAQIFLNFLHLDFYALQADQLRIGTTEVNRLVTLREKEGGMVGEYKHSTRTSMTFATALRDARHPMARAQPEDRPVTLLDRREFRNQAGILHRTFPLTSLLGAAQLVEYDFTSPSDPKDSRRAYAGAGFLYERGTTNLRFEAGPGRLDFKRAGEKDFRGVLGSLQASRQRGPRWLFQTNAARDLDFSIFETNRYYILDRAAVAASYSATRRLTLRAGSQAGRDTYDTPVAGVLRRDTFSFTSAGWSYATRKIRGGFDLGYYDRSSNLGIDEEDGIRILVHLSFTP